MSRQFIYHMRGLTKVYPGGKKVLDNIHLSFYRTRRLAFSASTVPANRPCSRSWRGSTRNGTARAGWPRGARVGYLPQEPQLDLSLNVRENVKARRRGQAGHHRRYNELMMNYSDDTAEEAA